MCGCVKYRYRYSIDIIDIAIEILKNLKRGIVFVQDPEDFFHN